MSLFEILVIVNIVLTIIVLLLVLSTRSEQSSAAFWTARKLEDVEDKIENEIKWAKEDLTEEIHAVDSHLAEKVTLVRQAQILDTEDRLDDEETD